LGDFRAARSVPSFQVIAEMVYGNFQILESKHRAGLLDTEGRDTIARFFAINLNPELGPYLYSPPNFRALAPLPIQSRQA
jgi:hypothetical protein